MKVDLRQIVKQALPSGDRNILVAVSGGLDSVVMLHLLCDLADECRLKVSVAHLDHGLRQESCGDAAFVAGLAARLGLPCFNTRVAVATLAAEQKIGLEDAGRRARRAFLQRVAGENKIGLIALAHHRDDQAETLLLRLARGSHSGLACMRLWQPPWWRPLLHASRAEILHYARERGLVWVEDSSNQDLGFSRNRIRHQVIPQLEQVNAGVQQRLAATASHFQLEEEYWQQQVEELYHQSALSDGDGLRFDRLILFGAHPALRLRFYRYALTALLGALPDIDTDHLHSIDQLLSGQRSQAGIDLPQCQAVRRYDQLWLRHQAADPPDWEEQVIDGPGRLPLPDGRTLCVSIESSAAAEAINIVEFDLDQLVLPLTLRLWRFGDRFVPSGMAGRKKLKRFFSDAKIEREKRDRALVLVSRDNILWIVGMRRSAFAPVGSKSSNVLRLELVESV